MISLNKFLELQKDQKNEKSNTLDKILDKINESEKIVILTHESPDGDAVGSSLAMHLALKEIGKDSDVIMLEHAKIFDFLPSAEEIQIESDVEQYDLAIAVDCADFKRIMRNEYFENAKYSIVIDHHSSNNMYGDINYVNPVSPACAEILITMFEYFKINITKDIGTTILTGIITDTGGFKYQGVTSETFEFAAELLRKGVDVPEIYKRVLQTKTRATFELSKRVTQRLEFLEDGKVTFSYIDLRDEEEVNAQPGDHEGLVELGRDVEGVEVAIFIRQKDENSYKVSMRSSEYVNVSDICYIFGGGGHPRAAGCLIQGNVEQIKEKIMKEIKKVIK